MNTPVPPFLRGKLGYLLWKVGQAASDRAAKIIRPFGLTSNSLTCLTVVCSIRVENQEAIATMTRMNKNQVVKCIDELERAKLAKRIRPEGNRRTFQVEPTEKGKKLFSTVSELIAKEFYPDFFGVLSQHERVVLNDILIRLLEATK